MCIYIICMCTIHTAGPPHSSSNVSVFIYYILGSYIYMVCFSLYVRPSDGNRSTPSPSPMPHHISPSFSRPRSKLACFCCCLLFTFACFLLLLVFCLVLLAFVLIDLISLFAFLYSY